MLMGTGLAHATQRRRFFEKKKDLRADRLRRESALTVMNDEGIEEMEEENEMRRWRRPPTRGEWAQEAVEEEAARVAAAQAAAAAAVADEREVQRLSQLPRAVMAFRKPAAIEGWKDARAMEAATAQVPRSTAAGIYGMVHALRPQGKDWQAYQAVPRSFHAVLHAFYARSTIILCACSASVIFRFCTHQLSPRSGVTQLPWTMFFVVVALGTEKRADAATPTRTGDTMHMHSVAATAKRRQKRTGQRKRGRDRAEAELASAVDRQPAKRVLSARHATSPTTTLN